MTDAAGVPGRRSTPSSRRTSRLDIVVNNAGITKDTLMPLMSDEDWDEVIATNLRQRLPVHPRRRQVMMRQRSGRIIKSRASRA